jgi:hypothetical protein
VIEFASVSKPPTYALIYVKGGLSMSKVACYEVCSRSADRALMVRFGSEAEIEKRVKRCLLYASQRTFLAWASMSAKCQ